MLYAIYGKDTSKARIKLTELLEVLQKKRPDASVFRMSSENWDPSLLDELLGSRGLFSSKYIIVVDGLLAYAASKEVIGGHIKEMAASEHVCVIIEEKIVAADLKKIESAAEKVQEFDLAEKPRKESPVVFAYADAVANRDSKKAWVLFQELVVENSAAEEIHGVLWWQFKALTLARDSKSAEESGLSPYVYQKAVRAVRLWEENALEKVLDRLVDVYHGAHRGEIDFLLELEKFSLKVI